MRNVIAFPVRLGHSAPVTMLLTGATGFLGSRLLLALLTTRNRDVTVLGRGALADLRSRVLRAMEAAAGERIDPTSLSRLRCVGGDITQPWLGLSPAVYGRLADTTDAVWHCAGDIALAGERERLFRVNVQGTARVLEFAEATAPECRLVHMSTVAVAGARRTGRIAEDDLSDSYGFETYYDESKYRAELLVREWTRHTKRPAIVLRPSVIASSARLPAGAPGHPLKVLGEMIDTVARGGGPGIPAAAALRGDAAGLRLRLAVPADAGFNIVQDDHATEAMLRIGLGRDHDSARGVRTFHITHPSDTPMRLIVDAVEARCPGLTLECVENLPDPTAAERFIATRLPGFLSYCHHTRTYDRAGATALTAGLADPPPVDREYLTRALGFGPGPEESTAGASAEQELRATSAI